jgi:RNA-binding protein YlmH
MKAPGIITGCTNPFHTHYADVVSNINRLNKCTFAEPSETFTDEESMDLIKASMRADLPGAITLTLSREVAQRFLDGDDDSGIVKDKIYVLMNSK